MIKSPTIIVKTAPTKIVTWADGTAAELAAMLAAHDRGDIDITDYWSIGDERTIHLNAIAANPNGAFTTAMDAQDVVMVLMNEGYMNQQGIHYVVGQKDCLNQTGRMNATATNSGSWGSSLMRTDLNNLYYNAFADNDFKALFKDFTTTTIAEYNGSTLQTVTDKVALFAEKEVFGSLPMAATMSNSVEASVLIQIEYYKTAANRNKQANGSIYLWWERSPTNVNAQKFCCALSNGNSGSYDASNIRGIAPFMCI